MKIAFTSIAATAALAMALTAVPGSTAGAQEQRRDTNVQAQVQVQHPDYSKNKYYTLGNREGYQDYTRKTVRTNHNHTYRNDDDRAAHDYGYQQGWQGQRGYHPETTDRH